MGSFTKGLLVVAIILTLALCIQGFAVNLDLDRRIDSIIDRAQVAGGLDDMLGYLQTLKKNMEDVGMTHGHTALIWTTPQNDMALHYESVKTVIERLTQVKDLPPTEAAYQVALEDARGVVRELPSPGKGWWYAQCRGWILIVICVLLWSIFCLFWYKDVT